MALREKSERYPGERKNSREPRLEGVQSDGEPIGAELKGENLGEEGKGPKTKEDLGRNSK